MQLCASFYGSLLYITYINILLLTLMVAYIVYNVHKPTVTNSCGSLLYITYINILLLTSMVAYCT